MKTLIKTAAAAAFLAGFAGMAAHAQTAAAVAPQSGTNQAERGGTETPAARAVAQAGDAMARAERARQGRDPLAMLVAARDLRDANLRRIDAPAAETVANPGAASAAADGPAPTSTPPTAETLFAEARTLARGDREMLARIDRVERTQARGLVDGPTAWVRDISADSHINWRVTARGSEVWRLAAIGDGDTDVDIRVFDENGNLVCEDNGLSHRAECTFTPRWTGQFTVRVINWGRVWTRTLVTSN